MKKLLLIGGLFFSSILCIAQIPRMQMPKVASMQRYNQIVKMNSGASVTTPTINRSGINRTVTDTYNDDLTLISRRNQAAINEIEDATRYFREQKQRLNTANYLISNGFPSWGDTPDTDYFRSAYQELKGMLTDSIPLNLEKAVFLIENAFLGNRLNYSDFQNNISERVQLCQWRMRDLKLNPKDVLAQNMVIYSLLTDTLNIKRPGTESTITNYPLKYNLDDYQSKKDFTSHFVSTLLATNTGQCYSMPLLYLIIAEKLGAEAYLSYSPMHSFVKIKDDKGAWYNLELTCRYILSDYHYMNNSYIKSEAIRNQLYLTPLSKKQTIASLMTTLGGYYRTKYGYDSFMMQCAHTAKLYDPHSIQALGIEADYETRLTLEIARLLNAPKPEILKEISPEAYKHYERMHQLYKEMDDLGYEQLPPEIYQKWLEHIASEKERESKNPQPNIMKMKK